MRSDEVVQLSIGGVAHERWQSYEIDSDLLTPADAWRLSMSPGGVELPAAVALGARVELRVGGEIVMTGILDELEDGAERGSNDLTLAGRDLAGQLVDCSARIFAARQVSLAEVMKTVVAPFGIARTRISAVATRLRERVNVEPGDTAWHVLQNVAEANGLWPWIDPDGTLVIGGPDYTTAPVATLCAHRSGRGNNCTLRRRRSLHDRYSEVTILGQSHGTETAEAQHDIRATAGDSGVTLYRPQVIVDHESDSPAVARDRARKLVADGRLAGYTLMATVRGHRIDAPGEPGHGALWMPGQRVNVVSNVLGIDAVHFILGRKFVQSRSGGTQTVLTIKEDGVWTLDAHPHKRKHRRGKNAATGEIIDLQ